MLAGCAAVRPPLQPESAEPTGLTALPADPDPLRFASELEEFYTWESKNSVPDDPVLFVGSSSIRRWNTAERFPGYPIVNRGFGGSHISDVNVLMDRLVLQYQPAIVVFYAGDNDVAAGKSPDRVVADFVQFLDRLHAANPDTPLLYLPIKPSLSRWAIWPVMTEVNERIRALAEDDERLVFVDLAGPMLLEDGTPSPSLFVSDGLHLNAAGYDLWSDILRPILSETWRRLR